MLHPDSQAVLALLPERPPPAGAAVARVGHALATALVGDGGPDAPVEVESRWVPAGTAMAGLPSVGGPDGADGAPVLAVRRYRPAGAGEGGSAILWLHGGGWVVGTLDTYDAWCRALAAGTGAQVFALDYRLAPECRHPGPVVDAVRAARWLRAEAVAFGVDPARLAVAGDSAGGHLAITAARWLARLGDPLPAALGLIYPVADAALEGDSVRRFGRGHYLTRDMMAWYWGQYVDGTLDPADPDLSPVRAADLAGLPPTWLLTAGCDLLRDEGRLLADRLRRAGVRVEQEEAEGMLHGFIRFRRHVGAAHRVPGQFARALAAFGV